jgi:small GTP-binding protein
MQLHKAGTHFFPWWPRASERQLKRDGYSMLADLVLRFDECHLLLKSLGYNPVFEHTGIERIRNEHYAMAVQMQKLRNNGQTVNAKIKANWTEQNVGKGTGPEPTPDSLKPIHIQPKQPVVCIIGHVNHGKTTLLDTLRGTKLANHEDGGITQDLYAYQCDLGEEVQESWNNKYRRNVVNVWDNVDDDGNPIQDGQLDANGKPLEKHRITIEDQPLAHTLPKNPPNAKIDPLKQYDDDTLLHVYQKVTFLDTPGHASFFDMRENGTLFSDLVLLVVSSTEGVCPQTLESIEYIKAFKLPVVVALTKTDLPNSNPNAVMKQLRQAGLNVQLHNTPGSFDQLTPPIIGDDEEDEAAMMKMEQRGIKQITPCIPISAQTGLNMDNFKETLMKCFMVLKPQADVAAPPVGLVLESFKEEGGRGTVMRVLLSSGVIEKNDNFISGVFSGRVKDLRVYGDITMNEFTKDPINSDGKSPTNLFPNLNSSGIIPGTTIAGKLLNNDKFDIENHKVDVNIKNKKTIINQDKSYALTLRKPKLGQQVEYAIPGIPLDIVGLTGIASAGDDIRVVPSAMLARTVAESRRMENEYPNQARFQLGGINVTEWTPPPMLFKSDYRKNPHVLAPYIHSDSILHPPKNEDEMGLLSDVDTENAENGSEEYDESSTFVRKSKKHSGLRKSKKTQFGQFDGEYEDDGDDDGDYSGEGDDYDDDDDDEDGEYDDEEDNEQDQARIQRDNKLRNQLNSSSRNRGGKKEPLKKNIKLMDDTPVEGKVLKKSAFSHNNPDTYLNSNLPDWNRVHEREFEYQRPFVIKGATAGGIKMIMDSIDAFNELHPDKKIHLVHANQGSLTSNDLMQAASAVDTDLDPDMKCPILLYRTRKPNPKVLAEAKKQKIEVFSYNVFDDLLKHMIGTRYYNDMFQDSSNLRSFQAGAAFMDQPLLPGERISTMGELASVDDQDSEDQYALQSQQHGRESVTAPGRRLKRPSVVPIKEESPMEKAMRLEHELNQQRFQEKIQREAYEERIAQAKAAAMKKRQDDDYDDYDDYDDEEEEEVSKPMRPTSARMPGPTRISTSHSAANTVVVGSDLGNNNTQNDQKKDGENAASAPVIRPAIRLRPKIMNKVSEEANESDEKLKQEQEKIEQEKKRIEEGKLAQEIAQNEQKAAALNTKREILRKQQELLKKQQEEQLRLMEELRQAELDLEAEENASNHFPPEIEPQTEPQIPPPSQSTPPPIPQTPTPSPSPNRFSTLSALSELSDRYKQHQQNHLQTQSKRIHIEQPAANTRPMMAPIPFPANQIPAGYRSSPVVSTRNTIIETTTEDSQIIDIQTADTINSTEHVNITSPPFAQKITPKNNTVFTPPPPRVSLSHAFSRIDDVKQRILQDPNNLLPKAPTTLKPEEISGIVVPARGQKKTSSETNPVPFTPSQPNTPTAAIPAPQSTPPVRKRAVVELEPQQVQHNPPRTPQEAYAQIQAREREISARLGSKGLSALSGIKMFDDNSPEAKNKVRLEGIYNTMLRDGAFSSLSPMELNKAMVEFSNAGVNIDAALKRIQERSDIKH